ncbi:MAG: hypothetical protein DIU68_004955 [Chloroflexota bacterium]|mgnify:CR=1 FL=1
MRQRPTISLIAALILGLLALFSAAPFALGSPVTQLDATDQQATINALINERFTQTAEASGVSLTATAEAQDAAATAFALTVDAAFYQALTATAAALTDGAATETPAAPAATAEATSVPVEAVGFRVVLAPETEVDATVLQETAAIVERRLRALGVSAAIGIGDQGTIRVEMSAPENLDQVLASVQQAGLLEFVDFTGLLDQINDFVDRTIATTAGPDREDALLNPETNAPFQTVVTGADIANASVTEVNGNWGVRFDFTEDGGATMVEFTGAHVGEPLAIVLDGRVISIPVIQSAFGAEGGLLQGGFDQEQANRLALQLNFGALPVGLDVLTVEPLEALPEALAAAPTVATSTPTPTATPDPRPTATTGQIQVVEEVFERGRMFYIEPLDQIWVMVVTGEGRGTWSIYPDTFEEGDAEFDPSIVPPDGLMQPERGFGKLWRENPEVREALGWAVTPEFGYVSEYRYQPGGHFDENGEFVPGPGYHVLFSLYGEAFRFNEEDNTWQLD